VSPGLPLGEILHRSEETVDLQPDAAYREVTVRLWGKGLVERRVATGAEMAGTRRFVVRPDQFILSRIDARNGACGIVPASLDGAVVSNDFPVFDIDRSKALPAYLGWIGKSEQFVAICNAASEGTTNRVRLQEQRFLSACVSVPPLEEQRRIATRIEELSARVHAAQRLSRTAETECSMVLGSQTERLFRTGIGGGWPERQLADFVDDVRYGTSEKTHDDRSGVPVLRMGNIQDGHLNLRDLKYLHPSFEDRTRFGVQRGDILVNRTNSAELVGKCAVFDLDDECLFASYLIRVRVDLSKAVPALVARYLNSPAGRRYMFKERKQMTGQANVNAKTLLRLPIALPSVVDQTNWLSRLVQLEERLMSMASLHRDTRAELDALLPSILDRAFKGAL
jgi:type I restriction enzyme S subunit